MKLSKEVQQFVIGLIVMAMFGGAFAILTFYPFPENNHDSLIQLVGGLNALAGMVIAFYFGKSVGDGEKRF
jgi:hypothetical protein